jgi:hypothetical protein
MMIYSTDGDSYSSDMAPSSVYTASTNDICQGPGLCEPSAQREEHGHPGTEWPPS